MKMTETKIITFTYTKDNGEVSNRKGITLGYSSPELALIAEIIHTDYFNEDLKDIKQELEILKRRYLSDVQVVLNSYELQQKTFKLKGISNEKEVLFRA